MTIPIAAGIRDKTDTKEISSFPLGKTIIRGIALFPRISNEGKINLFAIRLNYKTINIEGLTYGVIKLQYIQIPRNFNGYIGRFSIFGSFLGTINI
jgi:hypothetical protein